MSEEFESDFHEESENEKKKHASPSRKPSPARPVTQKASNRILLGLIAICVAFALFVVMLVMQKRIVSQGDVVVCVQAVSVVPEGVILTQENIPEYFGKTTRPAGDVPEGRYFTGGTELIGKCVNRVMYPNELLTVDCVAENVISDEILSRIEDPVLVSVDAEKLGRAVAGTLKPGDRVDVRVVIEYHDPDTSFTGSLGDYDGMSLADTPGTSILDENPNEQEWNDWYDRLEADGERFRSITEATQFALLTDEEDLEAYEGGIWSHSHRYKAYGVLENVYVQDVFNTAGENISLANANGNAMTATVVNLVIPSKYQDTLNLAVEDGTIFIAKVLSERETSSYVDPVLLTPEEIEGLKEEVKVQEQVVENRTYMITDEEGNIHELVLTFTDGVRTGVTFDGEWVDDVTVITGTYQEGEQTLDVQVLFG